MWVYRKSRATRSTSNVRPRALSRLVDSFDFDAQPESIFVQELRETIELSLASLKRRQARPIRFCFGIGMEERSLAAFGRRCGVTRERARQMQNKALKKLKAPFVERGFVDVMILSR